MFNRSTFLLAFCLSFFLSAQGQITKGSTIQFGFGDISLNTTVNSSGQNNNSTSFDPNISYGLLYMVSDHFALGGSLGTFSTSELSSGEDGLMPIVRYYFNPASTNLNWYSTTGVGIALGSRTEWDRFIIGGGFNHFLNENVLLETGLNVSITNRTEYNLGLGLLVYLSAENRKNKKLVTPAIGKGSWLIGVNEAALVYTSNIFGLSLQPNAGYFFTDRWLGGIGLNISSTVANFNNDFPDLATDLATLRLGANMFTRYYFGSLENRFRPFGHIETGFVHTNSEYTTPSQGEVSGSSTWLRTHLSAGVNLFLGPRVALEGALTFATGSETVVINATTYRNQRLGLDLGFQFFFGGAKE